MGTYVRPARAIIVTRRSAAAGRQLFQCVDLATLTGRLALLTTFLLPFLESRLTGGATGVALGSMVKRSRAAMIFRMVPAVMIVYLGVSRPESGTDDEFL